MGTRVGKAPYTLEDGLVPACCPGGQGKIENQCLKQKTVLFIGKISKTIVKVETVSNRFGLITQIQQPILCHSCYIKYHSFFAKSSLKQISVAVSFHFNMHLKRKEGKDFSYITTMLLSQLTKLTAIHKHHLLLSPYLDFKTIRKTDEYFLNGGTFLQQLNRQICRNKLGE